MILQTYPTPKSTLKHIICKKKWGKRGEKTDGFFIKEKKKKQSANYIPYTPTFLQHTPLST